MLPDPAQSHEKQVAFQLEVLFHHSNIRLPIRLERMLNQVIVTPRMHGIHHSHVQRETSARSFRCGIDCTVHSG